MPTCGKSHYGLWSTTGVPHKGWTCVGIEDLKKPTAVCEMCEITRIRYVHHMSHPNYPRQLECGCVCAGLMEESPAAAKERQAKVQKKSKAVSITLSKLMSAERIKIDPNRWQVKAAGWTVDLYAHEEIRNLWCAYIKHRKWSNSLPVCSEDGARIWCLTRSDIWNLAVAKIMTELKRVQY